MSEVIQSTDLRDKLTDWANEPTLLDLKSDFDNSKTAHDSQMLKIQGWNDLLHVRGKEKVPAVKGKSSVQPKLVRRQAEWRYSALTEPFLGTNKLFKISPVTFEDAFGAEQNELVLNYQFKTKMNRVKFIDDYVRSTVDEGTAILQTGWIRQTIKVKEEVPVYSHFAIEEAGDETDDQNPELMELMQAVELSEQDPRTYDESIAPEIKAAVDYFNETGQATTAVEDGTETVEVEKIIINKPTVKVHNPRNVHIDPSAEGDINKAMFVIVSFETCKAELEKEGRYKNLDKIVWENNSPNTDPDHETKTPDNFNMKGPRKKVTAYEYWGFYNINGENSSELVPFVATWIGNQLIRMELNPFPDQKLPFVVVPYLPVKRELYGEPDAELLGDNQRILGAVSRGMIDLLGKSANSQQGFAKGMLDPLNRKRFDSGEDYEFNPNMPPSNGHIQHKYPELPQSALQMLQVQNQEAEALTGVKSFSGGLSGEGYGDVAAGIRGVLDAASKREMAILRRLAQGITEVGRKIIAMNGAFLSEEETVRITNTKFVTVKREDLAGDFDMEVDISTAEVDNAKSQDLAFMLQTIGPNMDTSFQTMILSDIAKLKRMPELAHKIENYKPEPDPMQVKIQELEIKKLEKEIALIESEIALNEAKAEKTESEADITNLEYVERETGTTHSRELEKQQGQAEGNKELAITKALVTPRKSDQSKPDVEAAVGYNEITKPAQRNIEPAPQLPVDNSPQPVELSSTVPFGTDLSIPPEEIDPSITQ